MARAASTICSLCEGVGTQRGMDRDGNGGWKHKPGECKTVRVDAAALEAGHAERLAAAGLSTGLAPVDRADADAKARVLAKSPPTRASVEKGASARLAAHRVAVLDFLRPKSAGLSFSPGEIARGSGVLLEEVDVVIKALLASGEIEEIDEEEDEDPSYRAKPSAPAPVAAKPRVNRRGKPAVETARTCRVRGCGCTEQKSCDMGAGRTCAWTSGATPAEGDTCSLCADLIERAEEAIKAAHGAVPAALADDIFESCDAPALGATVEAASERLGACIEIAAARTKPTKKDRPTKKSAPAQPPIPGLGAARELTLPFAAAAAPTSDRGTCGACGAKLTPENSSKLRNGAVVHVGCARAASDSRRFVAPVAPIAFSAPCAPCGAASGEPCAFATPEPASYVHDARLAALPAEERGACRRRAAEDRIRVALDEHAAIPGDPPVPTAEGLVRGLVVPGDFDVFTLRDVLGAMIARGEVHEIRCVTERAGIPGATYLRRAEGGAPVVMGRVGYVAIATVDTNDPEAAERSFHEALDLTSPLANVPSAPPPGSDCLCTCDHAAIQHNADGCTACSCGHASTGEAAMREAAPHPLVAGHDPQCSIERLRADGRGNEPSCSCGHPRIGEYAGPGAALDLLGRGRDPSGAGMGDAPSVQRPVDLALHVEEPERVGVEQAEGDGGEAGGEGAHAGSIAAAPESRKENRHELSAVVTDRPLSPAERLLVALSEAVRAAEEAREAARACLAGEIAQRAAVEQLDAVQRERDEQTAIANALHAELADVRAERDQARANVTGFEEALRTEAYEKDLIARERDEQRAALATAKDLARLASLETADRGEETRAFRGALRSIVEKLGAAAPDDDADLISEAVRLATANSAAALAKKPAVPTPPTPIRRPWDMPAEEKENS